MESDTVSLQETKRDMKNLFLTLGYFTIVQILEYVMDPAMKKTFQLCIQVAYQFLSNKEFEQFLSLKVFHNFQIKVLNFNMETVFDARFSLLTKENFKNLMKKYNIRLSGGKLISLLLGMNWWSDLDLLILSTQDRHSIIKDIKIIANERQCKVTIKTSNSHYPNGNITQVTTIEFISEENFPPIQLIQLKNEHDSQVNLFQKHIEGYDLKMCQNIYGILPMNGEEFIFIREIVELAHLVVSVSYHFERSMFNEHREICEEDIKESEVQLFLGQGDQKTNIPLKLQRLYVFARKVAATTERALKVKNCLYIFFCNISDERLPPVHESWFFGKQYSFFERKQVRGQWND